MAPIPLLSLFALAAAAASPAETPPLCKPQTWCAGGIECTSFIAWDTNGDGLDDVITLTPDRHLLVAPTVSAWKPAGWRNVRDDALPEGVTAIVRTPDGPFALAADRAYRLAGPDLHMGTTLDPMPAPASTDTPPTIAPPPYNPDSTPSSLFTGDINGDGLTDTLAVFPCTRPDAHFEVRLCLAPNPASGDTDSDGLPDAQETALNSDPYDRDTDDDSLLDGWEVPGGFPRGLPTGGDLSPTHQDVVVEISRYTQLDEASLPTELARVAALYNALPNVNPDGATGIRLHFAYLPPIPEDRQHSGSWADCGNENFPARNRGLSHWMQVTPWGGGQAMQTGDMGGCGPGWQVFAHEFGHQLSLSHEGDSPCSWCPLYPSMMNYAFSYSLGGDGNAVNFSTGAFRDTILDESHLIEHLPYPIEKLRYLASGPFCFPLQDDGHGGTLIDWNQNGNFDTEPVTADINYGGSTNGGIRRDGDLIGAAPALTYVGDTCYLAQLTQNQAALQLKTYLGNEQWSEARTVPNSATDFDPVLVGTPDAGYLFFRQYPGWFVARFTKDTIDPAKHIPDLPRTDLSAGLIAGRIALISRSDDDHLELRWFDFKDAPTLTAPQRLELSSKVPVGFAENPLDHRIAFATAMPNSNGEPFAFRMTWFTPSGEKLIQNETRWVQGEKSNTGCTTRPTVSYSPDGQLYIFHTGGQQPDGQMIAWRTRQIGNTALGEGWLVSMMYDVWTRTRRAVSFANGPQGAIYAFRWDSGDYNDWKINRLLIGHNGLGIDPQPMRDFNDSEKMSQYGLIYSIMWMNPE